MTYGIQQPRFSGHETFPLRQLWLKKTYDAISPNSPNSEKSIFSDDDAIVRFGVGKNMVNSLKHWALATDIIEENGNYFKTTHLADLIFGKKGLDPFQEKEATSWLIHWKLSGEAKKSTTWFWFFNLIVEPSFDKDTLIKKHIEFASNQNGNYTNNTLKRDLDCCLRSYLPKDTKVTPEEINDTVLGDLNILHRLGSGKYEFIRGEKPSLPNAIFVYALIKFWNIYSPDQQSMSFDSIMHENRSPGRVFKLDEDSVSERLSEIENITEGKIIWTDSQGIRTLSRVDNSIDPNTILKLAYEE